MLVSGNRVLDNRPTAELFRTFLWFCFLFFRHEKCSFMIPKVKELSVLSGVRLLAAVQTGSGRCPLPTVKFVHAVLSPTTQRPTSTGRTSSSPWWL
jgi:hypothetical protein